MERHSSRSKCWCRPMRCRAANLGASDPSHARYRVSRMCGLAPVTTEPRGVVGFEVVLGALLAALDGGVISSISGGVEQRHGLF